MFCRQDHTDEDYISWVRRQKPATRARFVFIVYTLICSLPTVLICLLLMLTSHFQRFEIIGVISFVSASTLLFVFDSLRIVAQKCYDEACQKGLARFDFEKHYPVVSSEYV